ncbi:glutamate receptor ionotropic, kainate 2-like [Homalodisca vitripennis]|uniref:glutamate receptor ionotropic, kainate 2-like n=1 Tax=Homalodisca vitripennis TaxID=197043 RepID=UPI001EEBCCC8|nr:glutamate receptor ionotropic, kainate 2-like [Homalodisca vitripennis]
MLRPVLWILVTLLSWSEAKENLTIGGLFESNDNFMQQAFVYGTEWINARKVLSQFDLVPQLQEVDPYDNFRVSLKVCNMMRAGVAGIFGPHSVDTSDHVQSICDAKEIPHIEMRWDSRQRRGACLINLYPHPSTMSKVFVDLVKVYEWESFTLVYEDNDGLIRLNGLLTYYDHKGFPVTVRQLDDGGNFRPVLRRIKNTNEKNIVLDCSTESLYTVLLHAQQVGLMGSDYSYIITSLDLHTIDLEPFMYAGTNITGVRFFDPESAEVQQVIKFWAERKKDHGQDIKAETLLAETALVHDAVLLYAKALDEFLKGRQLELKSLSCDNNDNWEHGYSIINFMKVSEVTGLSGLIKFDHEGFRSDFKLDIIELTSEGIVKKGTWNASEGVNFTQTVEAEDEANLKLDLKNVTFVVMISLVDPHAMLRETTSKLEGNAKYEGMGIDVIHELSLMNGFNYTFREQEDGNSGNPDKVTGKWDGMIGKVIAGEADLAIADITITREREQDVDFTMPYMTLGISILYKKPKKSPSLFSFMSPFSDAVWKSVLAAYVGVSLLMYIIARISPKEWANPNPCIDESQLEEFENQFSLNNAFWYVTGAILQQGSELAPAATSTRLLASAWSFFVLIIANSYTANLAAFLTVERNNELFSSVGELAGQAPDAPVFVKYGAKAGGATEGFFKRSNHTTYQKMWQYMSDNYDDVMTKSNKEGVDRVLGKEEYAFLMESASIDYEVERKCQLRQVGQPLDNKGYGIVMPKKAWYRNLLSSSVIKLQEKGKLRQLYKKWWTEKRGGGACNVDEGGGEAEELDLDNVGGVFLVLVFGSLLACFIALGELMYEVFIKEDKDSFWSELKKELKFVISCKGTVKQLKPSSENGDGSAEEIVVNEERKSKTPNGLRKRS